MTRFWLWRRLTANFGWKLASIMLAAALWFAVEGEPELVTVQPVPVLYRNLPPRLMLLSDAPNEVRVELRGASTRLTRATLSDAFAAIDLAGVTNPGAQTFTLSEAEFSLPQGLTFVRAVPSQVSLRFDRSATKAVPVEIQLSGAVAPGFRIASKTVEPATLNVSGPESRVASILAAQTDPVDVSGLNESADLRVNAFVSEPRVQFESRPVVVVHLSIEKSGSLH